MATDPSWIDVTVPLSPALVPWPGDPPFKIERVSDMDRGEVCNVSRLTMSAHSGTHMDAPLHFVAGGKSIDEMPPDATVGPARVVHVPHATSIGPVELRELDLKAGERIIFKTRNSQRAWHDRAFDNDFVHISAAGARMLVESGVQTVGVDYLSIGGYERDGVETHQVMLGADICVIEGLDLTHIEPGDYELVCLPLRITGSDGAPARALLRPRCM